MTVHLRRMTTVSVGLAVLALTIVAPGTAAATPTGTPASLSAIRGTAPTLGNTLPALSYPARIRTSAIQAPSAKRLQAIGPVRTPSLRAKPGVDRVHERDDKQSVT